jgi:hypothetical protein
VAQHWPSFAGHSRRLDRRIGSSRRAAGSRPAVGQCFAAISGADPGARSGGGAAAPAPGCRGPVGLEDELLLFRRARRLHLARDPQALGAWDDYLRVAPHGKYRQLATSRLSSGGPNRRSPCGAQAVRVELPGLPQTRARALWQARNSNEDDQRSRVLNLIFNCLGYGGLRWCQRWDRGFGMTFAFGQGLRTITTSRDIAPMLVVATGSRPASRTESDLPVPEMTCSR